MPQGTGSKNKQEENYICKILNDFITTDFIRVNVCSYFSIPRSKYFFFYIPKNVYGKHNKLSMKFIILVRIKDYIHIKIRRW